MLGDDEVDPALAAPPPPFWCPEHRWVVCPLHEYGPAVGTAAVGPSDTSVFEFGGTSAAVIDAVAPLPPSPAPSVVEVEGNATAVEPRANTAAVASRPSDTVVDAEAVAPRLPSPTPATPPPSPRSGARRRLVAMGFLLPSPPSSGRGRRAGTWSPAALWVANGVAPGTSLPGDSSDMDVRGGSFSDRR